MHFPVHLQTIFLHLLLQYQEYFPIQKRANILKQIVLYRDESSGRNSQHQPYFC